MDDLRIVFMGTPEFAVPSLERLAGSGYLPVGVATSPDRPSGRGQRVSPSPVKEIARRLGIPAILQPASVKDPAFAESVAGLMPDVIVVVAFRILPPPVFETARLAAFNLHGSLLPRYRGAAPIHNAVLAGETRTGVTTFLLKAVVDTGDIILQREMSIGEDETTGDVHDRMMHLGAEAVVDTVRMIESGSVNAVAQDDLEACPAPKIHPADAVVNWTRSATEVHNHIRGMSPSPGAWTTFRGERVKMLRSTIAAGEGEPGGVLRAGGDLVVACGSGAVSVLELQAAGRRRLRAPEFLRGFRVTVGDRFSR
jgi:methionyl-tRNA formyltransferase